MSFGHTASESSQNGVSLHATNVGLVALCSGRRRMSKSKRLGPFRARDKAWTCQALDPQE
jgi:hypothetical protein